MKKYLFIFIEIYVYCAFISFIFLYFMHLNLLKEEVVKRLRKVSVRMWKIHINDTNHPPAAALTTAILSNLLWEKISLSSFAQS